MAQMLAQELVDNVADHLHDDKSALAAATTVSHSWLSACRFHLFATVRVMDSNLDIMDFVEFLKATPSIHRYVRKLCLSGNIDKSMVVEILTNLPCLTHLSIRGPWNLSKSMKFTKNTFNLEYLFLDFFTFSPPDPRTSHQTGDQVVGAIANINAPVTGEGQMNEDHDDEDDEDEEEDVDDQGLPILHGRSPDYVEARGLVGILSLFAHIGEFIVRLNPESTVGWVLSESDLITLIPTPGVLNVCSFNFSGSRIEPPELALFHRLLQPAGIQSFTLHSGGYLVTEHCGQILLGSKNLTHFALCVSVAGYRKFFRASSLILPHTVPFSRRRREEYGTGALSEFTVPVYSAGLRYKWAFVQQQR